MEAKSRIRIDLTRPNIANQIYAMQGDGNTRYVEVTILSDGSPWVPPVGVEVAVAYRKPDGTKGLYNKLADGTPAISSDGNVVTIVLAPQMLTVPGTVQASVVFNNAQLDQLTSFPFTVSVTENQYAGATVSEDYIRLEWLEDKLDEYLQKATDSGAFKGDPFTYEDFTPAQLAALQGPAGKSAYQYAVEGGYTGTEADFAALVAYDSRKQIELVKDTMIRLHEGVVNDASGTVIALSDASSGPLQGLRIFGRTTQDGTPTPEAPVELVSVGDGGSVGVTVAGKNLVTGITNGNSVNKYAVALYAQVDTLLPDTNYFISFTGASGHKAYVNENVAYFTDFICTGSRQGLLFRTKKSLSKDDSKSYSPESGWLIFKNYVENTVVPSFSDVQIEAGTVMTDYEAPVPALALPISTPNGLPGIPVTSGGNYTDADGQQWICDEVDFARGVYVQRVATKVFDGSESGWKLSEGSVNIIKWPVFSGGWATCFAQSSHFQYGANNAYDNIIGFFAVDTAGNIYFATGHTTLDDFKLWIAENPVTVVCRMATPIETPIPEDELAAYAALHTNRPNTTIYNDAGAYMDVAYMADTKLYIDQKINELATAIVSST